MHYKPIANNTLNEETLKASDPLEAETRHVYSTLIFSLMLEVFAGSIRQEQETEVIQLGEEEVKEFLFEDDIILCMSL